jgi:hypothetical protein
METNGRNQSKFILEYSAPKIELLDLNKFQSIRHLNLSKKIETKLEELKAEYNNLVDLYNWNAFVDTFECNIQCTMGQTYYLYETDEGRKFLSIIDPDSFTFKFKFHGATTLNSDGYFVKC